MTALRSSLFRCGVGDLWRWNAGDRLIRFSTLEGTTMPGAADGQVGEALGWLRGLYRDAR